MAFSFSDVNDGSYKETLYDIFIIQTYNFLGIRDLAYVFLTKNMFTLKKQGFM